MAGRNFCAAVVVRIDVGLVAVSFGGEGEKRLDVGNVVGVGRVCVVFLSGVECTNAYAAYRAAWHGGGFVSRSVELWDKEGCVAACRLRDGWGIVGNGGVSPGMCGMEHVWRCRAKVGTGAFEAVAQHVVCVDECGIAIEYGGAVCGSGAGGRPGAAVVSFLFCGFGTGEKPRTAGALAGSGLDVAGGGLAVAKSVCAVISADGDVAAVGRMGACGGIGPGNTCQAGESSFVPFDLHVDAGSGDVALAGRRFWMKKVVGNVGSLPNVSYICRHNLKY